MAIISFFLIQALPFFKDTGKIVLMDVLIPIGILLLSFLIGLTVRNYILSKLLKYAQKTSGKWDEILIFSLKRIVLIWAVLLGAVVALKFSIIPERMHGFLFRGITLLFILSGILFSARLVGRLIDTYAEKITGVPTTLFKNIVVVLLYIIGLTIILDYLGISIAPILTALGVGGLAVALALQDTLSNLFSGVHILLTKKIRPGDYINTDSGFAGYVADISWRDTTIRALPNNLIIIPNSKLAASIVTNYHLPEKEMAVLVQVSVSYASDLHKVEAVTKEVGKQIMLTVAGGLPEFDPFIRYHTFGDSGIGFTVILRAREFTDQYLIKHEFVKKLHEAYEREKIEIPFPIRTVIIKRQENAIHGLG